MGRRLGIRRVGAGVGGTPADQNEPCRARTLFAASFCTSIFNPQLPLNPCSPGCRTSCPGQDVRRPVAGGGRGGTAAHQRGSAELHRGVE
eukprot:scaffold1002_cov117-Isochrysis_galbana.AAC.9